MPCSFSVTTSNDSFISPSLYCLVQHVIRSTNCSVSEIFFFSIWVFFHEHSRFTGQQRKGEGICLTPLYHFHPLHTHLDISRAITAESKSCQGIIDGHLLIVTLDIFQMFLVIVVFHYSVNSILTRFLSPGYVFNINRRLSCYDLLIKIDVFCGRNTSWKLFNQAFRLFFFSKNQSIEHRVDFFETHTL